MYRSGSCPTIKLRFGNEMRAVQLTSPPSLSMLQLTAKGLFVVPSEEEHVLLVCRGELTLVLSDSRDLEELQNGELVELRAADSADTAALPVLRDYPLSREDMPCQISTASEMMRFDFRNIAGNGPAMLEALKTKGYFVIDCIPQRDIQHAFDVGSDFFSLPISDKNVFARANSCSASHMKLAQNLGYKQTALRKELYVYRQAEQVVTDLPFPTELSKALRVALLDMGGMLRECLKAILPSRNVSGMLDPLTSAAHVGFSSFIEIFKYDCSSGRNVPQFQSLDRKYRISCSEHRDTGVLTAIPRSQGSVNVGLEVFDWSSGGWRSVEEDLPEDSAIVFAGEMFPWFSGMQGIAPLNHRVVVPIQEGGVRFSLPVELLAEPSEASIGEMSQLACGLVSANY